VLKNQLIRLKTVGEEAFEVTLYEVKTANNRYRCSSMATSGCSLKLIIAREPIRLPACRFFSHCYIHVCGVSSDRTRGCHFPPQKNQSFMIGRQRHGASASCRRPCATHLSMYTIKFSIGHHTATKKTLGVTPCQPREKRVSAVYTRVR